MIKPGDGKLSDKELERQGIRAKKVISELREHRRVWELKKEKEKKEKEEKEKEEKEKAKKEEMDRFMEDLLKEPTEMDLLYRTICRREKEEKMLKFYEDYEVVGEVVNLTREERNKKEKEEEEKQKDTIQKIFLSKLKEPKEMLEYFGEMLDLIYVLQEKRKQYK